MSALARPMLRANTSGFTLTELLTVIAIIGVLAAIIIPVVGKVRTSARSSQCVSNLRQTYMGYVLHVNEERRGIIPIAYGGGSWIDTYANNLEIGLKATVGCQVQRDNKAEIWAASAWHNARLYHRTYSINLALNMVGPGPTRVERHLSSFAFPSRTVLLSDGNNTDAGGNANYYNSVIQPGRNPEAVHNDRANLVFLDGHVESRRASEIPTYSQANTPNSDGHIFWYGTPAH